MKVTLSSYAAELVGTFFFLLSILASGGNPLVVGGALAIVVFLIAGCPVPMSTRPSLS